MKNIIEDFEIDLINNIEDLTYGQISKVESLIRHSRYYKRYIYYIASNSFNNITSIDFFKDYCDDSEDITTELHHIITLYDLVVIAAAKLISEKDPDEYISIYTIADEVLEMHFKDLIPTVILAKNVHELVHAASYNIFNENIEIHKGRLEKFKEIYKDFIDEDLLNNIDFIIKYNPEK